MQEFKTCPPSRLERRTGTRCRRPEGRGYAAGEGGRAKVKAEMGQSGQNQGFLDFAVILKLTLNLINPISIHFKTGRLLGLKPGEAAQGGHT